SIPINRGPIQAIPTSLPPQPIGEATKASNLRRIPPGVQGRSYFTYFLYLIIIDTPYSMNLNTLYQSAEKNTMYWLGKLDTPYSIKVNTSYHVID
ncbi:hypothetical protein Tco_0867023, partial [Tanacetum coccineum]